MGAVVNGSGTTWCTCCLARRGGSTRVMMMGPYAENEVVAIRPSGKRKRRI